MFNVQRLMSKRFLACLLMVMGCVAGHAQATLSLAGAWDFSLNDSTVFQDYVILPGSMLTNGKGDVVTTRTQWTGSLYDSSYYFNPYMERYRQEGAMKFPFFLTPGRHYVGPAWYHRAVYVPREWNYSDIILFIERPHIETTVYVNGHKVYDNGKIDVSHKGQPLKFNAK